jgi:DUF1365 family protein
MNKESSSPAKPPALAPHSALYEVSVLHERFAPRWHRFVYRLFYFAIDLDELEQLDRRLALFSVNRANLFDFREQDFLPTGDPLHNPTNSPPPGPAVPAPASLKARALAFCAAHGADLGPRARVVLVTLPRVLGLRFNPVSFYFCFDSNGAPAAAIAEVTNTFHEVKPYFIPGAAAGGSCFRLRTPKHFYVSPFSAPDLVFDFTLRVPAERLAVRIDTFTDRNCTVHSLLTGRRRELTNLALAWFLIKYPLVTLKIVALIRWEAFRLWAKRVPFFAKADRAAAQRDLHHPHPSIAPDLPR